MIRVRWWLSIAATALAMVWAPGAAAAGTTTTASTPATTTGGATSGSTAHDDRGVAVVALLFGLLGVVAVLSFVYADRRKTLAVAATLIEAHVLVDPTAVPAREEMAALGVAGGAALVTIDGPGQIVVGVPADFLAKRGDAQVVAIWTADPVTAVAPLGDSTSRVSVIAKQPGAVKLRAEAGDASGEKQVTAVPAERARQALPFIGAGWGSVVVAIVVASVTAALNLVNALGGQATASILGGLVGYVVAKGQSESRPAAAPAPSPPPAGPQHP